MSHRQSRRAPSMGHTQAACRLGAVIALILTLGACEAGKDPTVSTPSAPTPPPPAPPPPSPPAGTVSGTAYEFTAAGERRPVPNLRLRVRDASSSGGAVGGRELPDVVTDGNGRYEIPEVTALILFFTTAPGSDHRFLCDFYPLEVRLAFSKDLPLVHVSWSGDGLPRGMSGPWGTSVYGLVSERVNGAVRPVAGATVTLDTGMQDPPATTNTAGFYMVCSVVGTDQYRTITARKDGYRETSRQIFGGWDFHVDLELARD
jgi:hypothetical protein